MTLNSKSLFRYTKTDTKRGINEFLYILPNNFMMFKNIKIKGLYRIKLKI